MKSRIFSSKHLKTISKGQSWIPAFITLGFLLAFPVTGMVKLSSWRDLQYSDLQIQILYNNLWKDGFVLSGLIIASIAAFINSVNGFIYLYSGKKNRFLSWTSDKKSRTVSGKSSFRTGILSDTVSHHRVSDDLYWSSARIFQPEYYGDGSQDAFPASHHLPGDLFQYCAGNQCDGKYADGYSVSGRYVPVWDCTQFAPCSLWTVILAYLLLRISVWWL